MLSNSLIKNSLEASLLFNNSAVIYSTNFLTEPFSKPILLSNLLKLSALLFSENS